MCERCDAPDFVREENRLIRRDGMTRQDAFEWIAYNGREQGMSERPYGDKVYWASVGALILIIGFVILKGLGF